MICYDNCHMSSEITQSVTYDRNYDVFQHSNFIFSQKFISLFSGLFYDETDLMVTFKIKSECWIFKCWPNGWCFVHQAWLPKRMCDFKNWFGNKNWRQIYVIISSIVPSSISWPKCCINLVGKISHYIIVMVDPIRLVYHSLASWIQVDF